MDPLTVSIVISAPREAVFDYLQDIANHAEFTDHFLVDWHLTRVDSVGRGAGARFRVDAPLTRFSWAEVTFAEVEPPHRIVELGRTGKSNRIRTVGVWQLDPAPAGATRLSFTLQTWPATLSDRLLESFGARSWMRRKQQRVLRRLRAILEQDGARAAKRGARVTVAGG
ncbi:MAG TPA: SRPBCC family protein [Solirubrobacteraceae bacterium]